MASAFEKKLVELALKEGWRIAATELPKLAPQLIRKWNAMALRGEREKLRRAILVEFRKNQALGAMIYEKYRDEMNDDVASIYQNVMGKTDE